MPTKQFSKNDRHDPYKNFRFIVKFVGRNEAVAGITKIGPLKRTTEVVKHRVAGDLNSSRKSPGQSEFEAITLERGVTHDSEFEDWASKVWYQDTKGVSLKDFRRDLIIELHNEAGDTVISYFVFSCWVSEFQALPELSADGNGVAIQSIKIENEGWKRDIQVVEPAEQAFAIPS